MKSEKEKSKWVLKIIIVAVFIVCIAVIINLAPNYIRKKETGKVNVIINNKDITESMKLNAYLDRNNVVYMSTKDIANFFDEDIFYDNKYKQIITSSDTKLAVLPMEQKEKYVNGSKVKIYGTVNKKEDEIYVPISELNDVYNVEINYIEESNIVTIDSLDREQKKANTSKDTNIKYKPTNFSKTLDKVKKGDSVIVIEKLENGWSQVRTDLGQIGYTKDITNIYTVREEMKKEKQIQGKVSLVWDYYTNYAPDRNGTTINGINVVSPSFAELVNLGKGELNIKIGSKGEEYIKWAHNNGYKVWAMIANTCPDIQDTTTEILNDYKLREKLINNIVNLSLTYELDGINIDFEYIKSSNKNMFSQFIIELAPRLREYGKILSVDVTAPDGSEDWSECYNRNKLGKVADYLIFMAYDQHGTSSKEAGTVAGSNWIETNIKKFVDREQVEPNKLILAMPFYTRLWEESSNSELKSSVVLMKNINTAIPSEIERKWNEDVKQYYVEYEKNGKTYKMWLEEEESIKAKFNLMKQYKLAGAAYWRKNYESENIWNIIEKEIK